MALHDGEPGRWRRWRLGVHLGRCAACPRKMEELRAMSAELREALAYHRAPPGLAARIGAGLPREAPPAAISQGLRRSGIMRAGLPWAGGGLAGAIAGAVLTLVVGGNGAPRSPVLEAVTDSHVRSMQADHLTDVLTSDRHTVKPWLAQHVDVSPPVRDLAAEGFPLVGGRTDYVDGHPAAVVVYRRAKHVINLFAWASPDRPDAPMRTASRQGFNVVTWRSGGITYYAVSDVEEAQLLAFARDVAGQAGPSGETQAK
jgi:anti-sigma factor RsiW